MEQRVVRWQRGVDEREVAWHEIDNVLRGNTQTACVTALLQAVRHSFAVVKDEKGFYDFCERLIPVLHQSISDRSSTIGRAGMNQVLVELRNALHAPGRGNALPQPRRALLPPPQPRGNELHSVQPQPRRALLPPPQPRGNEL
ncbi:MAG: hypothetical protein WCP53_00225, partial [Verrucomicrobiota bacterium]